jgi:hypothetical protein
MDIAAGRRGMTMHGRIDLQWDRRISSWAVRESPLQPRILWLAMNTPQTVAGGSPTGPTVANVVRQILKEHDQ